MLDIILTINTIKRIIKMDDINSTHSDFKKLAEDAISTISC